MISLPVFLALSLGSRSELLVSLLLGYLNFRLIFKEYVNVLTVLLFVLSLCAFILILQFLSLESFEILAYNTSKTVERFSNILNFSIDASQTMLRPFMTFDLFFDRFSISPLFGSGISRSVEDRFSDGTLFYHNDWFYLLSISGLVGLLSFILIILRFSFVVGWPVFIPLFLPGLTNTFILNIAALIAYFAVIGVLYGSKTVFPDQSHIEQN